MRRFPMLASAAAFGLLAVACASTTSGQSLDAGSPRASTPAPVAASTQPVSGPSPPATKPEVTVPDGPPPSTLQIEDISVGTGPEAKAGDTVAVQYVGVSYSTKEEFDSSWDRGQPFPFTLGSGQVIPGWDQGVAGMTVGGRRELIIPPDLAYGPDGRPPVIAPNETLVFVVDLVAIQ